MVNKIHLKAYLILLLSTMLTCCADTTENEIIATLQQKSVEEVHTGLPKVVITTPGSTAVTSKDEWLNGASFTIYNADGTVDCTGLTSIKGRGNSTWGGPKAPYNLKLNKKAAVLGMSRHKRWCLLANYMDRTLMRNTVALEIARQMPALSYTPKGHHVELFLNGTFLGNYFLCEHIKVDENRVNVTTLDETATEGLATTGGYLFEIDSHFDETHRFYSDRAHLPWQLKDPDEVNDAQLAYVRRYVSDIEKALYDEDRFAARDFASLMDLNSFIDYWFVQELTQNKEPSIPNSVFFHKDIDHEDGTYARLVAGPAWDFDCATFIPEQSHQFSAIDGIYYPRLFHDKEFRRLTKERWAALTADGTFYSHICDYIDSMEQTLESSDNLNSVMWPIVVVTNRDNYLGFHDAVRRLKTAFCDKYHWLDYAISKM